MAEVRIDIPVVLFGDVCSTKASAALRYQMSFIEGNDTKQEIGHPFDANVDESFNLQSVYSPLLAQLDFFDMGIPNLRAIIHLFQNNSTFMRIEDISGKVYLCKELGRSESIVRLRHFLLMQLA